LSGLLRGDDAKIGHTERDELAGVYAGTASTISHGA